MFLLPGNGRLNSKYARVYSEETGGSTFDVDMPCLPMAAIPPILMQTYRDHQQIYLCYRARYAIKAAKRHKLIKQIYTVTGFPPVEPMFSCIAWEAWHTYGLRLSWTLVGDPPVSHTPLSPAATCFALFTFFIYYEGPPPYPKPSFEPLRRVRKPLELWRIRETLWST